MLTACGVSPSGIAFGFSCAPYGFAQTCVRCLSQATIRRQTLALASQPGLGSEQAHGETTQRLVSVQVALPRAEITPAGYRNGLSGISITAQSLSHNRLRDEKTAGVEQTEPDSGGSCSANLHLDQLLVHEPAAVVQQLHRELAGAAVAHGRLLDAPAVARHHRLVAARLALEHRQPAITGSTDALRSMHYRAEVGCHAGAALTSALR